MGMDTRYFGPPAWTLMHGLPDRIKLDRADRFFTALSKVLPCIHCRRSFCALLRMDPVDAQAPIALANWVWRIHNAVNAKLGKPQYPFELRPIPDQEFRQALADFASVVALNYPDQPTAADQANYLEFFQLLGEIGNFSPHPDLRSRDHLYTWLITTLGLPDQRELIERIRV